MTKNILFLVFTLSICSCNKVIEPESPEKIFEKYKGSVVLIASQFYFEIFVDAETTYYYSPGSEKKMYLTKEDVLNNLTFSTGTGFIISENGEIITNNHVVNHKEENFKVELAGLYEKVKSNIYYDLKMYNDTIEDLKSSYYNYSNQMAYYEKERFVNRYNMLKDKKNTLIDIYDNINNIDVDKASSKLVIYKLGIAFNDTHITEFDDLQECVVVKTSENEKIDLALIQTKNKSFNTKPNFIFNFQDNNPNLIENPENTKERNIKNPIKINEDVFMIGYNKGFSLANTKQGIKSQFTSGKISQENDGERILYTIPTLEGSSGSPIIDKWGNLVGVNFAKITNSQSFSFGVPVSEVKIFYEE
jgi:S1-C subfamily serine protease